MSARGIRHILVDNLVNAPGDLFDGHAESPPKAAESITRRIDIQLHLTAKKIARIEVAENQIGVGDRWFGAALSETINPIHLEFMGLERPAILDDTEFGGGAAHVKR